MMKYVGLLSGSQILDIYLQSTFGYPEEKYAHIKFQSSHSKKLIQDLIHPTDGNSISSYGNHKKVIDENPAQWYAIGFLEKNVSGFTLRLES